MMYNNRGAKAIDEDYTMVVDDALESLRWARLLFSREFHIGSHHRRRRCARRLPCPRRAARPDRSCLPRGRVPCVVGCVLRCVLRAEDVLLIWDTLFAGAAHPLVADATDCLPLVDTLCVAMILYVRQQRSHSHTAALLLLPLLLLPRLLLRVLLSR